jgi:hypothetical protein
MGVGNLQIGIGQGGAQEFGANPAVAQFGQILAQKKAKQDADNKYLAETLAQAKPEGLRNDADRQNFYKKYADLKNQAISAENEPNKFKKAMALANVRQGVMDLNSYVDESKKQAAKENMFAQAYMQNPTAWSDQSIDTHRKSTNLAVDDPNVVKDYTTLARQPDLVKLDTRLKHIRDNELLSGIQGENMITGRQKIGNKMVNTVQTKYTADLADVNHAYLNEFDINPDFQHHLVSQYGHAIPPGLSPQDQKAALVGAYVKDLGEVSKYGPVKENMDRPAPQPSWMESWFMAHGGVPYNTNTAAQQNMTPIYRQKWVGDMLSGVPSSGEALKAKLGADPSYQGELQINDTAIPGKIAFNVPPKRKYVPENANAEAHWEQVAPARQVVIDKKDPNANIKLNELTNELTGEKVDISALQTPGGKKHIGTPQQQQKAATSKTPKQVHGAQDYDALQPGEYYMAPNGKLYQKK